MKFSGISRGLFQALCAGQKVKAMGYDLLIKNGTVVDGTGAPAFQADVAITQGRIADIGKIRDGAAKVIDASDLIVAPGFVDPHTHYDANLLGSSGHLYLLARCDFGHHGQLRVGIAPCKPDVHEIAAWDLVNVEGIPFDALAKGIVGIGKAFPIS